MREWKTSPNTWLSFTFEEMISQKQNIVMVEYEPWDLGKMEKVMVWALKWHNTLFRNSLIAIFWVNSFLLFLCQRQHSPDQGEQTLPPLLCRLQSKHEPRFPDHQPWLSLQNVDRATWVQSKLGFLGFGISSKYFTANHWHRIGVRAI